MIRKLLLVCMPRRLPLPLSRNLRQAVAERSERPAQKLSALRGKIVVLNFWATWCEPCQEELPRLSSFAELCRRRMSSL